MGLCVHLGCVLGGGWKTLRGCESNIPCVPALGGIHGGEGPMGAGGVHDTYSGPRWVQLFPPPHLRAVRSVPAVLPAAVSRICGLIQPHCRGRTPCVLPSPPPSVQPQYGPVIPVIPVPIRGSERSLRTPPPHRGPHRPRGMGGLREGDTEGDPKAEWDSWRHSGLGMGTAVRTPPAQGGLPGGGGAQQGGNTLTTTTPR